MVKFMIRLVLQLALLLVSAALVMGASEDATANAKPRNFAKPASVPADYVPTPLGLYVSPQCIITLNTDDAATVTKDQTGSMYGPLTSIPTCSLPRYNRDGTKYQQGDDLMDASSGNHDVIVSYDAPVASNLSSQLGGSPHIPLPTNLSGQTIFLTAALTERGKGWLQFLGFNMPGFKDTWTAGTAIADVQGNVIIQIANKKTTDYNLSSSLVNDRYIQSNSSMYRGNVIYTDKRSSGMNYNEDAMLSNNILFSIQTFGVTSCDMLPPSGELSGNYMITPPGSGALTVTPKTWTSGLCNLKASTGGQGTSTFNVKYDTEQQPKERSAKITYTTK